MKLTMLALAGAMFGTHDSKPAPASTLHIRNTFSFTIGAPQSVVTPLFGALRERAWDESWNPQFVYPLPAEDKPGAVFTVNHGAHVSTWINTAFDLEKGHIQYAYVIPEAMAVLIDIHAVANGPSA